MLCYLIDKLYDKIASKKKHTLKEKKKKLLLYFPVATNYGRPVLSKFQYCSLQPIFKQNNEKLKIIIKLAVDQGAASLRIKVKML